MNTENGRDNGKDGVRAKLLSGVGGLYTALTDDGRRVNCKARGNFRHYEISPYPGDEVLLRLGDGDGAMISEILPRKNFMKRPPMANIDKLFITVAAADPAPAYVTVDKLVCVAEFYGIEPVIIVTKSDLDAAKAREIRDIYANGGFDTFITSSAEGEGVGKLSEFVYSQAEGITSAFAGESGVGKSSLINALFPGLALKTGETSRIRRGKHTTRAASLFPLSDCMLTDGRATVKGGFIADTPGFGIAEPALIPELDCSGLALCFREFVPYLGTCRYTKCTHLKEEGCAVIDAERRGEIAATRREGYVTVYRELKERPFRKI